MSGCSACGYAVEWLRSCYSSRWRLYRGRPDVETAGCYYFAAEGTPFLPGPHVFGSLNWIAPDPWDWPLGQVAGAPRPWDPGMPPTPLPLAVIRGGRRCLTDGATYPPAIPPGVVSIFGMDSRCYRRLFSDNPTTIEDWDVSDVNVQLAVGQILDWLYRDTTPIASTIQTWLGSDVTVGVWCLPTDRVPDCVIVETPNYLLVVISGTRTDDLFWGQALQLSGTLVDYGAYSTIPIWQAGYLGLHQRIVGGVSDTTKPIVIVGHSYGAVVATLLAGAYHQANPQRPVRLLTFGMPKPGDRRVDDRIDGIPRFHLANDVDPVPALPPHPDDLGPLVHLLPTQTRQTWDAMRHPSNLHVLDATGRQTPAASIGLPWATLQSLVHGLTTGQPPPAFDGHLMNRYLIRLRLGAGSAARFPVSAEVKDDLVDSPTYDTVLAGALGVAGDASVQVSP